MQHAAINLMGKGSRKMFAIVPAVAFFLTFPMYIAGTMAPNALIGAALFVLVVSERSGRYASRRFDNRAPLWEA